MVYASLQRKNRDIGAILKSKTVAGGQGGQEERKNGNFKMRDSRPLRQKEKLQVIAKNILLKIFPDSKQKSRFLAKESNLNSFRVLAKKEDIMKTNSMFCLISLCCRVGEKKELGSLRCTHQQQIRHLGSLPPRRTYNSTWNE